MLELLDTVLTITVIVRFKAMDVSLEDFSRESKCSKKTSRALN